MLKLYPINHLYNGNVMPINLQGALAKSPQGEYMLARAALIMFPELTLEKQKEWLLTKKFDDKSILSFLASYDEYSARNNIPKYLTVCFEILKDFHSKTVLTSEEIFSLLEDESLQTICFFKTPELTPHYVALCNALCESALDVDRVRVMNRCLDIWRKAYPIDAVSLSVSVEHSAEVCYEFLEKCLAQRASAITIIEIVRRRGWYARWVTEQEIGAIFRILGQLFASNAYLEDENKTIITEIAKFLFSYSWSFNRSETEFSKLIEFFDEIAKTKDFKIGDKEILELFVVNPEKFTFRCHVQAHFSFLWKYLFKLVKSVDNKKIIQAFFIATRNGSFNSIDVPWNHSIIQILENIEKIPDYLRPNPQEFFLALAAFIEQDCFDDEVLKRLFRFKKQIVAATLQRIGEAKATGIDVLSPELNDTEYRLALASQDPTRGLGRFLNGCNEPAASTEALSELGKLLFKKEYLQKILEAIRAGHFNSDQLKGLAFLKDELLAQIEQEPQKVELYMEILNKKTLLGEYFHLKRRPVPNPLGPKNVQKARARLVERHMAEIIDKLKAYSLSSSFLEGLGNVRKEIIAHIAS
ncbi:MAG TPA: hypothetical protein VD770_00865, partial [Coxiellaceae bacterium]|nr:hypothetical protein [Coxiellaceae bacterium]